MSKENSFLLYSNIFSINLYKDGLLCNSNYIIEDYLISNAVFYLFSKTNLRIFFKIPTIHTIYLNGSTSFLFPGVR